jgi:RNA-directed DNA polymerase
MMSTSCFGSIRTLAIRIPKKKVCNFVGGVVSPILANIYWHYALELGFEKVGKRHWHGEACLSRYADDDGCACEQREDAERFSTGLGQRWRQCGRELSGDKTRLWPFSRHPAVAPTRCEVRGFAVHWGKDRAGKEPLKRRTSRPTVRNSLQRLAAGGKAHRPLRLRGVCERLHSKRRGYSNYYGVHGNTASLPQCCISAIRLLRKWLNRRRQRHGYNWHGYKEGLKHCKVERPRIVGRPRPQQAGLMA